MIFYQLTIEEMKAGKNMMAKCDEFNDENTTFELEHKPFLSMIRISTDNFAFIM